MISNLPTNPRYWRDRAEEIRVIAERSGPCRDQAYAGENCL
jgi:hypothetical protein